MCFYYHFYENVNWGNGKNFLPSASPPPACPNFTHAVQLWAKCNGGLTSRIGNECILIARIFSIILFSSWSFLLLYSYFPYSYPPFLSLPPPPPQTTALLCFLSTKGNVKSTVKGVLTAFCSAVSASKSIEDGKDSCTKTLLSHCIPVHVLEFTWMLGERGWYACIESLNWAQSLQRLKCGYGDGSVVWKDLNCVIVA